MLAVASGEDTGAAVEALGSILVASSDKGVCAILLGNDPAQLVRDLQDRFPRARLMGGNREYEKLVARVVGFVEAPAGEATQTCIGPRGVGTDSSSQRGSGKRPCQALPIVVSGRLRAVTRFPAPSSA